jgi:nitrite reductase (NADH) large subunit
MSEDHMVIIGNGPAGNQAALTLREKAPTTRVTLISNQRKGSCRSHLLPDLIAGKIREDALYACSAAFYGEEGIKLRSGQQVVGVDLERNEVVMEHKEILPFDGLILAVGGSPRIPERLLAFQDLMLTLKTLEDAKTWMERLSKTDFVLMIGGDLTSLAVTKALLHLGKKVYFMVNEEAFWPLRYEDALFEILAKRLEKKHVEVLPYSQLKGMARLADNAFQIRLDERTIEVGIIGAFFGLVPNVRFLARCGLQIDRGVLVDQYLNTGVEAVYAAGDCAQIYHPEIRDYWVSIGHDNAAALGQIAALNLLGGKIETGVGRESIFDVQGINVNTSWWMEF